MDPNVGIEDLQCPKIMRYSGDCRIGSFMRGQMDVVDPEAGYIVLYLDMAVILE